MRKTKYNSLAPSSPRHIQLAKKIKEVMPHPREAIIVDNNRGINQYCNVLEFLQFENGRQYYVVEYINEKDDRVRQQIPLDQVQFM